MALYLRSSSRLTKDSFLGNRKSALRYLSTTSSSSSIESAKSKGPDSIAIPTTEQLRIVALRAAIPMIGFGFMDNLVMITAGDAIDSTFGVAFGLSTLTAAGFGQCCSDVAGNVSGGAVDAAVSKLHLPHHGLSEAQLEMKSSRLYKIVGACVGVVTGCLLGMSCLFFMDTERADRARKARELESIFNHIMGEGRIIFGAQRATLFMLDEDKNELWSQVATGTKGIIKVKANKGIVGSCVQTGEMINVPDAYEDKRFNPEVDGKTGFRTKSILAMPVKSPEGKILGAIQMVNKQNEDGTDSTFGPDDEKLLTMMASHVTSFIQIVEG